VKPGRAARWATAAAVFTVVMVAAFLPVLFALAPTGLHDGDDLPSGPLLAATTLVTAGAASLAAWEVDRLLRRWLGPDGGDPRDRG
jgi:hypothetical protein